MGSSSVVLFTRDLRVHDQPALSEAVRTSGAVVPLFVLDDALLGRAPSRLAFLLEALGDLRRALRAAGGDLVVRRGDPVREVLRVAQETRTETIYVGEDGSAYAQRREARLKRACAGARLALRIVNTVAAVAPGDLTPAERDHYRVFTPYWRRWREVSLPALLEPPARLGLPEGIEPGRLPTLAMLTSRPPAPGRPSGGEREGRRKLERWLSDGLPEYERARNQLFVGGTSRLSPYLHFGCVSANEVVTRARAQGAHAEGFVRQLCWRDFYAQLLAANPSSAHADLRPRGAGWRSDDEALARWSAGETGYPIIDAAMRQLRLEAWMHNRARLLVGSFLTKTLGLHWRDGERVFAELLVDGDVASNVGNWQWVAGTGVDTRPGRIFNPLAQAKRLDPDGSYVRAYVPELAELDGPAVHEPWRLPLGARIPDYPARIVDHEQASVRFRSRLRARDATAA